MSPRQKNMCFDCEKDVASSDKALQCCICDKWFQSKCQRVTNSDYELLIKSDDSIQWYCKTCKGASQKLFKMITLLSKKQDEMESKVEGLCKSITDQSHHLVSLREGVTEMKDNLPQLITEKLVNMFEDKVEEEKREANLIFFNVPETDNEGSLIDDEKFVKELCSDSLGVEDLIINKVHRLGAKPKSDKDKQRLLKVVIRDGDARGRILRNAYKLKDANVDHKKIGISKDLTQSQRDSNKQLRVRLEKLKKDKPNQKWAIRRGKIIELNSIRPSGIPPRPGDGPGFSSGRPGGSRE